MSYRTILTERAPGVLTVTLNRPDVLNAFNETLSQELIDVFTRDALADDVRVVVLTGAGRAFCSGQDLKDISDDPERSLADSLRRRYNPLIRAMRSLPKPIICAINGAAAGAGASLALACDLRFMSEKAKLIQVFIRIGLVPDSGSSWFLPHMIGYARAFELCTSGRDVAAPEALEMGLVNKVLSPEMLMEYTQIVAKRYAEGPTAAYGRIKEMLNRATSTDLETALLFEEEMQEAAGRSHDYAEGKRAFLEKRAPKFEGR
jgi:2-(1,2-epoxy-1,2-dihydrophenyl)acetyl-CoA isomerase